MGPFTWVPAASRIVCRPKAAKCLIPMRLPVSFRESSAVPRPNPSRARRRTYSIRFFGDDMRRRASRMEWHSWLKDLPLKDGDLMRSDERVPLLWPH